MTLLALTEEATSVECGGQVLYWVTGFLELLLEGRKEEHLDPRLLRMLLFELREPFSRPSSGNQKYHHPGEGLEFVH